jgi:hypothetical protein
MSAQDIVLFGGGHAHVHVLKSLGVRLVTGVGLHTTRFTDSLEAGGKWLCFAEKRISVAV